MKKKLLKSGLAMALCVSLMACGQSGAGNANGTTSGASNGAGSESSNEVNSVAGNGTSNASMEGGYADASEYVASIDNATIDAGTYLDYSAGIEAGVYKWVLSEDSDYYVLASVDESGNPKEVEEKAINIGANNSERGGGMNGPGGNTASDGNGQMNGSDGNAASDGDGQMNTSDGNAVSDGDGQMNTSDGNAASDGDGQMNGSDGNAASDANNEMPGNKTGKGQGMGPGGMMRDQGTVYEGVYTSANITNDDLQRMNIYVPVDYFETDAEGNVTGINENATVGDYTALTAPIVYSNEFGGWRSSQPKSANTDYIKEGMIYVTVGGRSRDAVDSDGNITGKSPTQAVDLKAGVIQLRANTDVIPGDTNKIVSVGTSGGGQMSSILGASGNMSEYYDYMYDSGVLGITKNDDGAFSSAYPDNIYAAQAYCPIADIENADLAYAWWWVNLVDDGGTYGDRFTDFEVKLQELEANAFVDYINGLGLTDEQGNALTLTGLREGTYYDAILQNISDALNAMVATGEIDPKEEYGENSNWFVINDDGTYTVTDMDGFMIGTGLAGQRNKAVPGFDTMDKSAEGDAFGTNSDSTVHFSASVAQILSDHYEELSKLDGFNAKQVDNYIEEALKGESAELVETQTNLLNATEIMLGNNGLKATDAAKYWRVRSGTADQHTSFSVGYNIALAAQMNGQAADYHLVWNMRHGSEEGESTGTFIEWIKDICK